MLSHGGAITFRDRCFDNDLGTGVEKDAIGKVLPSPFLKCINKLCAPFPNGQISGDKNWLWPRAITRVVAVFNQGERTIR